MEREVFRERPTYIRTVHKRTGLCEYGKKGRIAEKMRGCLVFRLERIIDGGGR